VSARPRRPPQVAVFGSARLAPDDPEYAEARRLGELIANAGWTVCTGGYDGAMAAVSEGAAEAGGHVVGVTVAGWARAGRAANRWVREERAADGLIARLAELLASDAWVAVAGGVGTLSEVALAWNLLQTGDLGARPLVTVGPRWRALLPVLREQLVVDDEDLALVRAVADAEAAVAALAEALGP
jgi:uncharacterized protein (TIGR00730 family)